MSFASEMLRVADEDAAQELLFQRKTSDGLPVVIPTPARVHRVLLNTGGLEPDFILGEIAPLGGCLTVEKLAINAVMAGCSPDMFPVVIAAARALLDPVFDIRVINTTQHCVTPFLVVNGPMRRVCGVASGVGAFGPGFRANATIGRAMRLILLNVGGAVPGEGDMAVLGSPAKFSFCIAEAEEESPFEPLHVSRGFDKDQTVVTALGVEGLHQLTLGPLGRGEAESVLRVAAVALASPAATNIYHAAGMVGLVLTPQHATHLAAEGFTREKIQQRVWELAVQRRGYLRSLSPLAGAGDDDDVMHVVKSPQDVVVIVAGDNAGAYSAVLPTVGNGENGQVAVSKAVELDEACEYLPSVRSAGASETAKS